MRPDQSSSVHLMAAHEPNSVQMQHPPVQHLIPCNSLATWCHSCPRPYQPPSSSIRSRESPRARQKCCSHCRAPHASGRSQHSAPCIPFDRGGYDPLPIRCLENQLILVTLEPTSPASAEVSSPWCWVLQSMPGGEPRLLPEAKKTPLVPFHRSPIDPHVQAKQVVTLRSLLEHKQPKNGANPWRVRRRCHTVFFL